MLRRSPQVVTVAFTIALLLIACSGSLSDGDVYWHIMIGRDILPHWRFGGDPSWTLAPADLHWVTTQWASEVLIYLLHEAMGWYGLTLLRVAGALGALAVLAPVLLRGRGWWTLRVVTFFVVGFAVATSAEERPLTI